jgi:predicted methyltransferase
MKPTAWITFTLLVAAACGGTEQPAPVAPEPIAEPVAAEPVAEPAAGPAAPDPEAEKAKARAEVAKALAELEAKEAVERERWTPELRAKVAALGKKKFKNAKDALKAILASPHRTPGNAERDAYRHPLETLTFFGIKPTSNVIELGAGGGWYTEILAPLLRAKGKLTITSFDPNGPDDSRRTVYGRRIAAFLARSPEAYDQVAVQVIEPPAKLELGAAGSADLVIAMREMHGWHNGGNLDAYLAAIHAVLKDGGTFGVEEHRAAEGAEPDAASKTGYMPQAWLVARVEAAGFKLAGTSEVNANPKDTKDHPEGVWTLPPGLALGDKDKDKYLAIGESDRMTLRFTKIKK